MAHTQYFLNNTPNTISPERLLYISSATYGKDWSSMLHSHSFVELFYVVDGEGYFCTESDSIPIRKNSLIIINPNLRHTEKSSNSKALTYIALGVESIQFSSQNPSKNYCIYDIPTSGTPILPIMQSILKEAMQKKLSFDIICQHYLSILLLCIARITNEKVSIARPNELPPECELIKNYIDQNFEKPLTLDKLAELSHLNKFYLSHIFSKTYGVSPINYLLERRILHSKELLRTSDYSLTQIAHATGFSSSNYFSQSFKKYTGATPKDYRKTHKTSIS